MKLSICVFILFLLSCTPKDNAAQVVMNQQGMGNYAAYVHIVVIDSCEYVVAEEWQKCVSIIHKQNCRFCAARKLNQ